MCRGASITYVGWRLNIIDNTSGAGLWFSDGGEVGAVRGGSGLSSRLIVGGQGFLDITDLILPNNITIDFNGYNIYGSATELLITIGLRLPGDGTFTATAGGDTVSGSLKPLPEISEDDIVFIDQKIKDKYIPYQNIPDAPGKTDEQIRKLGEQFFPFTSHSFELAMCVYDWTTASFARMVFLKVFEYTGMEPDPFYPLNKSRCHFRGTSKVQYYSKPCSCNRHLFDATYLYLFKATSIQRTSRYLSIRIGSFRNRIPGMST